VALLFRVKLVSLKKRFHLIYFCLHRTDIVHHCLKFSVAKTLFLVALELFVAFLAPVHIRWIRRLPHS